MMFWILLTELQCLIIPQDFIYGQSIKKKNPHIFLSLDLKLDLTWLCEKHILFSMHWQAACTVSWEINIVSK